MKTPPILSIIIPVYNIEAYLNTCVESVRGQIFSDFELILINDGSSDSSGALCDEQALADTRIRVIHESHNGPSAARNTGLEAATGKYIGFVDGDDWIEPDMYALLYKNAITHNAELSACGFIKVLEYQNLQFHTETRPEQCLTPTQAIRSMFLPNHMRYSSCNKLFHRSLFEGIRYPNGRFMEDKSTTYKLIHRCSRISWCASPKYHYFMRPDSIMHSESLEKYFDLFKANDEFLEFIHMNYPKLNRIAASSASIEYLKLLKQMKNHQLYREDIFEKCISGVRKNRMDALMDPNTDFQTKWKILLASLYPDFFVSRGIDSD